MTKLRSATDLQEQEPRKGLQRIVALGDSKSLCLYPGKVHGGLLATILDEAFAEICAPAVTANLNVTYSNPTPPGSLVLVEAQLVKVEGRKLWLQGSIKSLEDDKRKVRTVLVKADGLFTLPRTT